MGRREMRQRRSEGITAATTTSTMVTSFITTITTKKDNHKSFDAKKIAMLTQPSTRMVGVNVYLGGCDYLTPDLL